MGSKLRAFRTQAGLTAAELARRIGVTPAFVWNIESGRAKASPRFARDASLILGAALGTDAGEVRQQVFGEVARTGRGPGPTPLQRVLKGA